MSASTAYTYEQIFSTMQQLIADALSVDEAHVTPEATLHGDLGAESIDFVDIVFRCESAFGIKIPCGELFPEPIFQGESEYVCEGRVTERGLDEFRARLPFADLTILAQNPLVKNISNVYTVGLFCRYLEGKLGVAP